MDMIGEVAALFFFIFIFSTLKRFENYVKNRLCGNRGQNQQKQYISNETSISHPDTNWSFHLHFTTDVNESTVPSKAS